MRERTVGKGELEFEIRVNELHSSLRQHLAAFVESYEDIRKGDALEKLENLLANLLDLIASSRARPIKKSFILGIGGPLPARDGLLDCGAGENFLDFEQQAKAVLLWLLLYLHEKKSLLGGEVAKVAQKEFPEILAAANDIISAKTICRRLKLPFYLKVRLV